MGRKKNDDITTSLSVGLNIELYNYIMERCKQSGLTASKLIRKMIMKEYIENRMKGIANVLKNRFDLDIEYMDSDEDGVELGFELKEFEYPVFDILEMVNENIPENYFLFSFEYDRKEKVLSVWLKEEA